MPETRRVVIVDGEGRIETREESIPQLGSGEVLVEVEASLITPGSGASTVKERREDPDSSAKPLSRGYQNAGTVAQLGEGVERFDVSERVACMGSGYALHSDYVVVPCNLCVGLPQDVSYEEGAFNHLAATGLQAVRRGVVDIGEHVAVMGLGLVGQLTGLVAQAAGAHASGVDYVSGRVETAKEVGFEHAFCAADEDAVSRVRAATRGFGIDCGFVCFGGEATQAFEDLIAMTAEAPDGHRYGRIVIVGIAHVEHDFPLELGNMDVRAASRTGPGYHDPDYERGEDYPQPLVRWSTQRNLREVTRLIQSGDLLVEPLITHRYDLDDADKGYNALLEDPDEALGVVLHP